MTKKVPMPLLRRLSHLLESIKFAHSVFALPFALLAMIAAAQGWPPWRTFWLILVCMVSARSAAMAFNRWTDRESDAANPRTQGRPTVTGLVSPGFLLLFVTVCCAVFCGGAWLLNGFCFACALPVLAVLLGYSYSKRFTSLCHFWLGLSLGLAPAGAHAAVRGDPWPLPGLGQRWGVALELFPVLLGLAVLFWVAGFDVIYACQDYAVDMRDPQAHSLPKKLGIPRALRLSAALHFLAALLLLAAGVYAALGPCYYAAAGIVCVLLLYEHWIVSADDLSRVNTAFFTLNGAVSLLLFVAVLVERVILHA
ncbi:MAG: UbiA-like polyprenyltransferase [Planctomycetota bacterium]